MYKTAFTPFPSLFIEHLHSALKHNMEVQHYHDVSEFYLQLSGQRYLFCNGKGYTLEPGDLLVIKPFDLHYTQSKDATYYERYVLNFSSDMLLPFLTPQECQTLFTTIDTSLIHLSPNQLVHALHHFQIIDTVSKQNGFLHTKYLSSSLFQLMMFIIHLIPSALPLENTKLSPDIDYAIQYIEQHYLEPINLSTISEVVHMSKYHFCRLFHQTTGVAFLEYLHNIRLAKAHKLLLTSKLSLNAIAIQTGFSSSAHLSRVFKQAYHMSPQTFRRISNTSST